MKWLRRRTNASQPFASMPRRGRSRPSSTPRSWTGFASATEAHWASLPRQTLKQTLTGVRTGRCRRLGRPEEACGRTDGPVQTKKIVQVERRWDLRFPPDYRDCSCSGSTYPIDLCWERISPTSRQRPREKVFSRVPTGMSEQDLVLGRNALLLQLADRSERAGGCIQLRLSRGWSSTLNRTICGSRVGDRRPQTPEERSARVQRVTSRAAPRAHSCDAATAICWRNLAPRGTRSCSVYQSDIVVYGEDLRDFLLHDLADDLGLTSGFATPSTSLGRDSQSDRTGAKPARAKPE